MKTSTLYMRKYRKTKKYKTYFKEYIKVYMRSYRRRIMIRLRKTFGGKCKSCSSKKKLQFAHIRPTGLSGSGRGKYNRILDIRKHPDCYNLLCEPCHRAFDKRRIK